MTFSYTPVLGFLDSLKSEYFIEGTIKTLRSTYIRGQRLILYKIGSLVYLRVQYLTNEA